MWIFARIAGVIGILILVLAVAFCAYVRWIPAWTSHRRESDENALGSGSPSTICMCRIPARYVFIVCGDKPLVARCAAK